MSAYFNAKSLAGVKFGEADFLAGDAMASAPLRSISFNHAGHAKVTVQYRVDWRIIKKLSKKLSYHRW